MEPIISVESPSGALDSQENDIFVAVMGVTGSGKSTFITKCTEGKVQVGHDLQACTQTVDAYPCLRFPGRNVYLVDTPGFDDTLRSDKEVLKEIATWLGATYRREIRLSGIIYLHRITDTRMQGSAKRNLLMFQKLCGPEALKQVILATTMWEKLDGHDEDNIGRRRELELTQRLDFWGWMVSHGSQVFRHYNTWESAKGLLESFVYPSSGGNIHEENKPIPLQIQREIVDGNKTLDETGAGKELEGALARETDRIRKEIAEMQTEVREAMAAQNAEAAAALEESLRELSKQIVDLDRDRADLRVSLQTMYEERIRKLEENILRFSKRVEPHGSHGDASLRNQPHERNAEREKYLPGLGQLHQKSDIRMRTQALERPTHSETAASLGVERGLNFVSVSCSTPAENSSGRSQVPRSSDTAIEVSGSGSLLSELRERGDEPMTSRHGLRLAPDKSSIYKYQYDPFFAKSQNRRPG